MEMRITVKTSAIIALCQSAIAFYLFALIVFVPSPSFADEAPHQHALAMHGVPELPPDFSHFPYVNPHATKGGTLRTGIAGSFDSLNTMAVKGNAPSVMVPLIVQPLMMRSMDEPFTLYGLLAESVATPPDRHYVEFRLNSQARFADGAPVKATDVAFSWQLFTTKGRPNYRRNALKVSKVEIKDVRTIRFTFHEAGDYEFPLILALMPVLPEHATDPEKFETMGFTPFLGSGPYALDSVEPGARITLHRRAHYWGADLPSQRGLYNFDRLEFEFFRDSNTLFEAFRTGLLDVRVENDPAKWRDGYDIPAVREGKIIREELTTHSPKGMSGFIFNTRRTIFADIRVREALFSLFDFEWLNKNLFSGTYRRTTSFFDESELAFHAAPLSAQEAEIIGENAVKALPPSIKEGVWRPPISDGSGRDRAVMRRATHLLREAGYVIQNGVMLHEKSGNALTFEIMVTTREKERIALAFADGLKQVGIRPIIRLVDSAQYWARLRDFAFDMIIEGYVVGASPGQEQINRWSSIAASQPGSLNWAGVQSPHVDKALAALLAARERGALIQAVRSLDRLLIAGHYVLPLYHLPARWVARWSHLKRPTRIPRYDFTEYNFWLEANQ